MGADPGGARGTRPGWISSRGRVLFRRLFLLPGLAGAMPRCRVRGFVGPGSLARPGQLGAGGVEVALGAFGPGAQLAA